MLIKWLLYYKYVNYSRGIYFFISITILCLRKNFSFYKRKGSKKECYSNIIWKITLLSVRTPCILFLFCTWCNGLWFTGLGICLFLDSITQPLFQCLHMELFPRSSCHTPHLKVSLSHNPMWALMSVSLSKAHWQEEHHPYTTMPLTRSPLNKITSRAIS